jgi:hypothetical protein
MLDPWDGDVRGRLGLNKQPRGCALGRVVRVRRWSQLEADAVPCVSMYVCVCLKGTSDGGLAVGRVPYIFHRKQSTLHALAPVRMKRSYLALCDLPFVMSR